MPCHVMGKSPRHFHPGNAVVAVLCAIWLYYVQCGCAMCNVAVLLQCGCAMCNVAVLCAMWLYYMCNVAVLCAMWLYYMCNVAVLCAIEHHSLSMSWCGRGPRDLHWRLRMRLLWVQLCVCVFLPAAPCLFHNCVRWTCPRMHTCTYTYTHMRACVHLQGLLTRAPE